MRQWYTVKVKYAKEQEDGSSKNVTEAYLLSAVSFTDAEAKITEEVGEFHRGEFQITAMSITDISEIFRYDDSEKWFLAKTVSEFEDGDTGRVTKIKQNYLVTANSVNEASIRVDDCLKDSMMDYNTTGVVASSLLDVFEVKENLDVEISRNMPEAN